MAQLGKLPARLHHTAYVTRDQEKTRRFYEDVIGLPLMATWCESDELFGKVRTYVHTFYGIGDGGGARLLSVRRPCRPGGVWPEDAADALSPHCAPGGRGDSGGHRGAHCEGGYPAPDTYVLEHGYCRSVYVTDPNGLILEFTLDHPDVARITRDRRADAHQALKRWLAGDHTSNNTYR